MKKVLIFSHAMEIGGAERALLGLLETIDTTKYEVDLFLMRHSGELMKYIPDTVKLLPEIPQYTSLAIPFNDVIRRKQFRVALGRFIGKKRAEKTVHRLGLPDDNGVELEYSHKYTLSAMPNVSEKEYDLAISFLTPHYFVAERVTAKKKVAWIHTDYTVCKVDTESEAKMWDAFDSIISISEKVTDSFAEIFPSLVNKLQIIENMMPVKYMSELANEFDAKTEMPDEGAVKLLSIGRFSYPKNFDNVPEICRDILKRGIKVRWYLIGFGSEEHFIRQKVEEAGMQDNVIILGKKENPYPYIKACDIYVQPSRYEGKSVAVREAQFFHKPVVITNYSTAGSQLKDGYDGMIVPVDNKGCAAGLSALIKDNVMQQRLIENTKRTDYTNASEIEKLYHMMEN